MVFDKEKFVKSGELQENVTDAVIYSLQSENEVWQEFNSELFRKAFTF